MKQSSFALRMGASLLLCGALSHTNPAVAGDYACHVFVVGGKPAILLIETESSEKAAQIAANAKARPLGGPATAVATVEQCIDRRHEKFASTDAQELFKKYGL